MKSLKEVKPQNEGPNGQSNPTAENEHKPVGYGSSMQTDSHANGMDRRKKSSPNMSDLKKANS